MVTKNSPRLRGILSISFCFIRLSLVFVILFVTTRRNSRLAYLAPTSMTEQYFPALLFIILYKSHLTLGFVDEHQTIAMES